MHLESARRRNDVQLLLRTVLLCLGSLAVCAGLAGAQPAPKPAEPPPPRLETTAQFGLLATTGNTSTQSLSLGWDMAYRPERWVHTAKVAFAQNEDEGELKARSLAGLYRASRVVTPRLSAYGQYAYLRDLFSGIEHRHTLEGGLSYVALDRGRHQVRLDGALGYQNEVRLDADDASSAVAIGGAGYRWRLSETSEFTDEVRIVLPFAEPGEWKLDQVASLTAALTSVLSLRVSNTVRFVHDPVPGFEQTDTITAVALVLKVTRPQPPAK